jgi:hypothetical protein
MNDEQLNRLIAAARQAPPETGRAEFGFETRLLARLRAERPRGTPWLAWTWRLAPVFAAIVIALGIWTFTGTSPQAATEEETLLVALLASEE